MDKWYLVFEKVEGKRLFRAAFVDDERARNYICLQKKASDYSIEHMAWYEMGNMVTEIAMKKERFGLV